MQFHLNLQVEPTQQKISHHQQVLMMGSCFTEHIGHTLQALKFNIHVNPFGIVFNPESMAQALHRILSHTSFTADDLLFHDGAWHGMEAHGQFSSADQQAVLRVLNHHLDTWHAAIQAAHWLVLTPGTAYAYTHKATGRVVANCHKIPQQAFSKALLTHEQVVKSLSSALLRLWEINPGCQVITTVSPVKHLRDGVVENSLSKAVLIQGMHALEQYGCTYFPAYELVTDDLRDYRFYEKDMAHPNRQAIEYVWQKFSGAYFDADTVALNKHLSELSVAMTHRPHHPGHEAFRVFKQSQALKCKALQQEFPFLDLDREYAYFTG